MSFFEPIDPPGPPEPPHPMPPWVPPHDGVLGGFVPLRIEVARTSEAIVLLGPMEALPTGVRITLQLRSRRPNLALPGFGPHAGAGAMRLGVGFADGRRTEGRPPLPAAQGDAGDGPVLVPGGGGGGGGSYRQSYWLWPLPPPGPLRFVVLWEDAGIPETSVEVDAQVFLDAAEQAETLWEPLTPEEEQAAHRAMVERHRSMGGAFSAGTLRFGFADPPSPADDDPSGDDDEYL